MSSVKLFCNGYAQKTTSKNSLILLMKVYPNHPINIKTKDSNAIFSFIAVATCIRTNQNPRSELRRSAPQLVFWFCALTSMAAAILGLM
jgi:hypothetical protein